MLFQPLSVVGDYNFLLLELCAVFSGMCLSVFSLFSILYVLVGMRIFYINLYDIITAKIITFKNDYTCKLYEDRILSEI